MAGFDSFFRTDLGRNAPTEPRWVFYNYPLLAEVSGITPTTT
jgi:hypothetical protein